MKKVHIFFFFLMMVRPLCHGQVVDDSSAKQSSIDSIRSAVQIEGLISRIDSEFRPFRVNAPLRFRNRFGQKLADSLQIRPWEKADLDGNGRTDLLVMGNWGDPELEYQWMGSTVLCLMDNAPGPLEIRLLNKVFFKGWSFARVVREGVDCRVEFYDQRPGGYRANAVSFDRKMLVYKWDDFIEWNPAPAQHRIEKISFSTTPCFGFCPVFSLEIGPGRAAVWNAYGDSRIRNREAMGRFDVVLDEGRYRELCELLNYIDFESLKDQYAVDWTDDQTSTLTLTYDNGKQKKIRDYGLRGTHGLIRVYQLLFDLRENQEWKRNEGDQSNSERK